MQAMYSQVLSGMDKNSSTQSCLVTLGDKRVCSFLAIVSKLLHASCCCTVSFWDNRTSKIHYIYQVKMQTEWTVLLECHFLPAPTLAFLVPRTFFCLFFLSLRCFRLDLPFSARPNWNRKVTKSDSVVSKHQCSPYYIQHNIKSVQL